MNSTLTALPWLSVILLLGALGCLPLYGWNVRAFLRSSLAVKVAMWVPLYLLFVLVAHSWVAALAAGFVAAWLAVFEWRHIPGHRKVFWYTAYFVVSCAAFPVAAWIFSDNPPMLVALCLVSVFSDVAAFFLGNFVGTTKLPVWVNSHKSYEGVFGQLLGAMLGMYVMNWVFAVDITWLQAVVVGVASAAGDIANSVAKRQLRIKDWGTTIPGHGGVNDRFSSLFTALLAIIFLEIIVR